MRVIRLVRLVRIIRVIQRPFRLIGGMLLFPSSRDDNSPPMTEVSGAPSEQMRTDEPTT